MLGRIKKEESASMAQEEHRELPELEEPKDTADIQEPKRFE